MPADSTPPPTVAATTATVRLRRRQVLVLPALLLLVVVVATWSLGSGAVAIDAREVAGALWRMVTGAAATGDDTIVTTLRLPRTLFGLVVGAGLAAAGVAMQGLFRNPLADPALIGVSSGAAFGAVATIVFGGTWFAHGTPPDAIALGAFASGLSSTLVVWSIGRRRPGVATLLLAGVAINAIALAGVGWLQYLASERQLRDLTFWSLGSLAGTDWKRLFIVLPCVGLPLLILPTQARALNALLLGEHEAAFLGFRPARVQKLLIALVALMVSSAVAFTGIISFIGLVVPHLLRLSLGPDHRLLLPASALGGAALVPAADTLARTLAAPAELPLGVLTALVGGPFFLWLLLRSPIVESR